VNVVTLEPTVSVNVSPTPNPVPVIVAMGVGEYGPHSRGQKTAAGLTDAIAGGDGGFTVTVAEPDLVGSCTLVALTVACVVDETEAGAV